MSNEQIKNGDRVRHRIHGFEGIVMGTVDYLTGCRQMLVCPEKCEGGGHPDSYWYDEGVLQLLTAGVHSGLQERTVRANYQPPAGGLRDDLPGKRS